MVSRARRPNAASLAACGLAGATAVTAGAFVVALSFPTSGIAGLSGLSWVFEARAEALTTGDEPGPAALQEAAELTRASLRTDPANPTPWLRLAYIDSLRPEGLGVIGRTALTRSYTLAPLGPDDSEWRLTFAFNHWGELDPPLRALALKELEVVAMARNYRAFPDQISDPIGKVAVTVMMSSITARKSRSRSLQRAAASRAAL